MTANLLLSTGCKGLDAFSKTTAWNLREDPTGYYVEKAYTWWDRSGEPIDHETIVTQFDELKLALQYFDTGVNG